MEKTEQSKPSLASCTDEELKALIENAQSELRARETQRRKQALSQIRKLAKAHGLDVQVSKKSRRNNKTPRKSAGT